MYIFGKNRHLRVNRTTEEFYSLLKIEIIFFYFYEYGVLNGNKQMKQLVAK